MITEGWYTYSPRNMRGTNRPLIDCEELLGNYRQAGSIVSEGNGASSNISQRIVGKIEIGKYGRTGTYMCVLVHQLPGR
jgi:hypothetical protein